MGSFFYYFVEYKAARPPGQNNCPITLIVFWRYSGDIAMRNKKFYCIFSEQNCCDATHELIANSFRK